MSDLPSLCRGTMGNKPVLWRTNTRTVLADPSPEFGEKLLCDGIVVNMGDACAFSCTYCYVKGVVRKFAHHVVDLYNADAAAGACGSRRPLDFHEVVIRRANALRVLESQLVRRDGSPRYSDPEDRRVAFTSSLVDPAPNMDLLRETAEACKLILQHTGWQIRLLSKSSLLAEIVKFIPPRHHHRLIFGFSTGTIDDRTSRAIETGAPSVSKRIKALRWLQDRGFRTFAMICPSLPQENYDQFSRNVCEAICAERCEHVWAEAINVRPDAMPRTLEGLLREGLHKEAEMLRAVHGPGAGAAWEDYTRQTFLAHARNVPAGKLRYLQYVTNHSAGWWARMRTKGAVLLGADARRLGLCETPARPAVTESDTTPSPTAGQSQVPRTTNL